MSTERETPTPDDATDVINGLLWEAAELATASTAKLKEALALAEQAYGETPMSKDWQRFGDHPDRCHHARLATTAEIAHLQEHQGPDVAALAGGCFVYAVSRIIRDAPPLKLQRRVQDQRRPCVVDEVGLREKCRRRGHVRRDGCGRA